MIVEDSQVVKAFFLLIRAGLWDSSIDKMECFPLSINEWKLLYKYAITQTVEGIVYDGIQKLPTQFQPPRVVLLTWVVRLNGIERANSKMNLCIKEQLRFFKQSEVSPILLKGQGIASYYPVPNHRVCGDIDWYFDLPKKSRLMTQKLKAMNIKVFSSTADSINYSWRGCEVEHHTKLFDVFSPIAKFKLNIIKKKQLTKGNCCVSEGEKIPILEPSLNIMQVNLHILKHLLSFGIGIRQFCDAAILYDRLDGKYDKKELHQVFIQIGVINWIHQLHDLLVNYLGLSLNKLPFPLPASSSSAWMVKDVLSAGNFGFYDERFAEINKSTVNRKNKSTKLWYSFRQYYPLAPYEALSFPIIHFCERFKSLTFG